MLVQDSIERIRAYRVARGWSINRLATEAAIGWSTIRRIESPDWNPNTDTLKRLEAIIPADFAPDTSSAALSDEAMSGRTRFA